MSPHSDARPGDLRGALVSRRPGAFVGWRERLRRYVMGPALDLAVFRVTVALVIASSGSVRVASTWAALPEDARVIPAGVGWLVPHLPITPALVQAAQGVLWVACVTTTLGVCSRLSGALLALSAFYVLLVPQLGGAVFHDHHLLWFAALLALSPCGDALSIDAWWGRRRGFPRPASGVAHGLALRVAWLLAGLIYLFPVVHKLHAMGVEWALGDNLRHQLWWKWAQDPGLLPAFRIDRYPALLHALGLVTLGFELSFVVLVMVRRTHVLALVAALAFHVGTHLLMGIDFHVLYVCYLGFLPWSEWRARLAARRGRTGAVVAGATGEAVRDASGDLGREADAACSVRARRRTLVVALGGVLLLLGVVVAGARGAMQAYPFACYPTFAYDPGQTMPALAVDLLRPGRPPQRLSPALYQAPGPRGVALDWRLAGAYGDFSAERLSAWWRDVSEREPLRVELARAGSCRVRFTRVRVSVDPDAPPREAAWSEELLLELPCAPLGSCCRFDREQGPR
ncbi:MAG: HTTM domain-containing protein [Myxococcales bacterium]|nr:HTTM domain-containing protein [Myxococcales bacterium]